MESSPVRFAIIGAGAIAAFHARAIAATSGAKLMAVHHPQRAKAEVFAGEHGGEPVSELDRLLGRADVDVVCITVPSGLHGDIAIRALEAGKHVLCEKPLEITTARIDAMLAAAERSGKVLAGVFQNRFADGAQHLKRALERGRFGRLSLCSAYLKWWRDPAYYSDSTWRGTKAMDGGGALMNQGVHSVDLLQWLAGMPARVTARVKTLVHDIEVEDSAVACFEFPGGAMGVMEASTACYPGAPRRLEIMGEKGTAILENDRIIQWSFAEGEADDEAVLATGPSENPVGGAADPKAIGMEGHRRVVEDLAGALREGRPPLVSGQEARKAVAVIEAIHRSSETSKPVEPRAG
ncbi:MAG: Gfo/Idh/MocA family protein [Opitutaceae bacterium]